VAEMFARLAWSMALTPKTGIPMADNEAARQFARDHIAPAYRPAPAATAARGSRTA